MMRSSEAPHVPNFSGQQYAAILPENGDVNLRSGENRPTVSCPFVGMKETDTAVLHQGFHATP
jgi:hypothetical protein